MLDIESEKIIKLQADNTGLEHITLRSDCEGEWHNKVRYRFTASVLHTDEECAHMFDSDHHLGPSVLSSLPVGLVSQFPLDCMHLVCLGVTHLV